uniref:Putative mynd zn-finger protein/hormone receptor interactor n=1 Tax=Panstrongylus lignarius TaxID=156445 RepID=A0A224XZV6_9HEMI
MTIKICIVCNSVEKLAKYKCPSCRSPYCSVSCCKQHKLNGCNKQDENQEVNKQTKHSLQYQYPTQDTIPLERLHLLRQNKKLKDILGNPHLRTILESVNSAENPTELVHEAMLEPIFVEFADECLKVVQVPEK